MAKQEIKTEFEVPSMFVELPTAGTKRNRQLPRDLSGECGVQLIELGRRLTALQAAISDEVLGRTYETRPEGGVENILDLLYKTFKDLQSWYDARMTGSHERKYIKSSPGYLFDEMVDDVYRINMENVDESFLHRELERIPFSTQAVVHDDDESEDEKDLHHFKEQMFKEADMAAPIECSFLKQMRE